MIDFRPLTDADFPLLLEWLGRPHVREWWDDGDDTLAKVAAHYSRDQNDTKRFVAELHGEPIGYFQYSRLSETDVGTDQFLADVRRLSKGLGTTCLRAFLKLIAVREQCLRISVDPHPSNHRAIRCYEKCGFTHDPERSNEFVHFMQRRVNPADE